MKKLDSKYKDIKLTTSKDLTLRRIVYVLFIIIFMVVTPIILLYTQGYRYNFKRGKVQKTGIFIVSSIPKKADVYLNNKIVLGDQTPARIEKLLPADYEIKLAKDGYHDWTKKLQISQNSTTFAEDVILWKNTSPTQLSKYQIIDWQVALDNKKAVFINEDRKIISFDFNSKNFSELFQTGQYTNPKLISWSNTSKKILVKSTNKYLIIDVERYYIKPIEITNNNYKTIKWDLNNDNFLYAANDSGVWKIDLFTKATKLIFNKDVADFIIVNDNIYYFFKDVVYKQKLVENKPEIIDGIKCDKCQFLNFNFSKLILMNPASQAMFIIDPELKNKTVRTEAKNISWLNYNTFLFYNNWEIWIYEAEKKEPELITRIGSGISDVIWHTAGRHIIFTTEDKIKIIELDNRELRNIIELFSGNNIHNLSLNNDGKNIYFNSQITDQTYIAELNIK